MPRNQAEMATLKALVLEASMKATISQHTQWFIGVEMKPGFVPGRDSTNPAAWQFIDGTDAPFYFGGTFWYSQWVVQPDNWDNENQRCAYYIAVAHPPRFALPSENGVWGDEPCSAADNPARIFRSICEKEPVGRSLKRWRYGGPEAAAGTST